MGAGAGVRILDIGTCGASEGRRRVGLLPESRAAKAGATRAAVVLDRSGNAEQETAAIVRARCWLTVYSFAMSDAGRNMLQRVADVLSKDEDIELALAFGSVTAGKARTDSDLDIALLTRKPMAALRKRDLIASIAAVAGRPIDLVDLRTAGVHLTGIALRTGKRLVCRTPQIWVELLARNLVDAADFLPYRERILAERRQTWIR